MHISFHVQYYSIISSQEYNFNLISTYDFRQNFDAEVEIETTRCSYRSSTICWFRTCSWILMYTISFLHARGYMNLVIARPCAYVIITKQRRTLFLFCGLRSNLTGFSFSRCLTIYVYNASGMFFPHVFSGSDTHHALCIKYYACRSLGD